MFDAPGVLVLLQRIGVWDSDSWRWQWPRMPFRRRCWQRGWHWHEHLPTRCPPRHHLSSATWLTARVRRYRPRHTPSETLSTHVKNNHIYNMRALQGGPKFWLGGPQCISVSPSQPFRSAFRCSWWFGRTQDKATTRQAGILCSWPGRLEQSTTAHSFGTDIINFQKHDQYTSFLTFLLHWLTVSRVRAANIVRRPCSD